MECAVKDNAGADACADSDIEAAGWLWFKATYAGEAGEVGIIFEDDLGVGKVLGQEVADGHLAPAEVNAICSDTVSDGTG